MPTRRHFTTRIIGAAAGLAAMMFAALPQAAAQDGPLVFAAASLQTALDNINEAWSAETGKQAVVSYAASGALARQIEEGAPADIFMSADLDWMEYLSERDLTKPETELQLLGNRIVLIAAADSDIEVEIAPGVDLAGVLGEERLATGDVEAVPVGRYAKAALESLGIWDQVEGRLAQAENVRAAMALVSLGEALLGIVYATDAAADSSVKVVGMFPEDTHPPIIYPVGLTAESENPDAVEFYDYLQSDRATELFEEQGFTVLTQ